MRAEELIVEIYRQRSELVERGQKPTRVLLSARQYKIIQEYRSRLGELSQRENDYLDAHRVFDLEICIEQVSEPDVQTKPEPSDGEFGGGPRAGS